MELTNNAEKIQHMALKIQTQEEVINIAKGEIEDYERMKPHPESEVINLNSKLDQLRLEGDSLKVKHAETVKKLADVSSLCNELRNKLKSAVGQRDQAQQLTNLYEGKFSSAERQLKELEFKVHQGNFIGPSVLLMFLDRATEDGNHLFYQLSFYSFQIFTHLKFSIIPTQFHLSPFLTVKHYS